MSSERSSTMLSLLETGTTRRCSRSLDIRVPHTTGMSELPDAASSKAAELICTFLNRWFSRRSIMSHVRE
jgi:hypothetical protein